MKLALHGCQFKSPSWNALHSSTEDLLLELVYKEQDKCISFKVFLGGTGLSTETSVVKEQSLHS